MIKKTMLMTMLGSILILSGCAFAPFPVPGVIVTKGKGPFMAVPAVGGERKGQACAESYLGLVALGDASIGTAMKDGGVTEVSAVDFSTESYLMVYAKFCTIVTGR